VGGSLPPSGLSVGFDQTLGVAKRNAYEPFLGTSGNWIFEQRVNPDYPEELESKVTNPLGQVVVHYFSTPEFNEASLRGWEYGLPYGISQPPLSGGSGLRISQRHYSSGGALAHSVWVDYTHDLLRDLADPPQTPAIHYWINSNRRPEGTRLKIDGDGNGRYVENRLEDFDGLGHFRKATTSGFFSGSQSRVEYVAYDASGLGRCYAINDANQQACTGGRQFVPLGTGVPWILERFAYRQQGEGSDRARQIYQFDPATGFLSCIRALDTHAPVEPTDQSPTLNGHDLLVQFLSSSTNPGAVGSERYFGGDGVDIGTSGCSPNGAATYRLDHDYQYGVRNFSRYVKADGSAMPFALLDATIDASTGLVSLERNTLGTATDYSYDLLGRLTLAEQKGPNSKRLAKTAYIFTNSTSSRRAKVKVEQRCPTNTTGCTSDAVLAASESHFDGFGRIALEKVLRPDGGWSQREIGHNPLGWLKFWSEWGDENATLRRNKLSGFDVYGRAITLTPPDGAGHKVTMTYSGLRESRRTVYVGAQPDGGDSDSLADESTYDYVEEFDIFGRLIKAQDPVSTATYGYDIGNRLAAVSLSAAGIASQSRSFTYGRNGLLRSESHPEKSGLVKYDRDARGNPWRIEDGSSSRTLLVDRDRAERVTRVYEVASDQTQLDWRRFEYDSASDIGSFPGKLLRATSINDYSPWGLPYKITVEDRYSYDGRGGSIGSKSTQVYLNALAGDAFSQSFSWTPLGDIATQSQPTWSLYGSPHSRTIANSYSHGFLESVSSGATVYGTLAYHPNLTLSQVLHGNGVAEVSAIDPYDRQRPADIAIWKGGTLLGGTGTFAWDGSGNPIGIGPDRFRYDGASRLVEATLVNGVTGQQSYSFDGFGNLTGIAGMFGRNTPTTSSTNRLTFGSYDAGGNLTGYNGATYRFDDLSRMLRMTNGSEDWAYGYDANGLRVLAYRIPDGQWHWSPRDLDGQVARKFTGVSGVKTVAHDFIYRGGLVLADETPAGVRHFSLDHLGTPRFVTNAVGNTVGFHTYFPFGDEITASTDGIPLKFTGHERDANSTAGTGDDLDYMKMRFFNPVVARFESPDLLAGNPHAPQTWNRYAYVVGNPLRFVDPLGLTATCTPQKKGRADEGGWKCEEDILVSAPPPSAPGGGAGGGGGTRGGGGRSRPGGGGNGRRDSPDEPRNDRNGWEREVLCKVPPGPRAVLDTNTSVFGAAHFISGGRWAPMLGGLLAYHSRNRGIWDFKRQAESGQDWQDFGNFHFGAMSAAAGLPYWLAERGGGIANWFEGEVSLATVLGPVPHGDEDMNDLAWVTAGYVFYQVCQ